MENTADKKPLVIDGKLRTHKKNKDLHGIGMNSIRRTLTRYDASLDWSYNADNKIFSVTIVLQNNKKIPLTQNNDHSVDCCLHLRAFLLYYPCKLLKGGNKMLKEYSKNSLTKACVLLCVRCPQF